MDEQIQDVNTQETVDTSSVSEVKEQERTVPLQALQEERRKRQELEQRLSALETSVQQPQYTSEANPDLEDAINKIEPYLKRKGFMTKEQWDEERNANAYAEEMKNLTGKYDGKDGRPVFDAYEVSEYGKRNKIYNLEAAYEQMYKNELLDWAMKKSGNKGESIETEKGTSGVRETGNTPLLTREMIAKKVNGPDGKKWWEENRMKVMAAYAKGEIS